MYKNREIYNIACKSIVLTCLAMLFVGLVYINDLSGRPANSGPVNFGSEKS